MELKYSDMKLKTKWIKQFVIPSDETARWFTTLFKSTSFAWQLKNYIKKIKAGKIFLEIMIFGKILAFWDLLVDAHDFNPY